MNPTDQFPSLPMRLVQWTLKRLGGYYKASGSPQWRRSIEKRAYPSHTPVPRSFLARYQTRTGIINGLPVYWLAPRQGQRDVHVVYTHGGAYIYPLHTLHWNIVGQLIDRLGASVTVPIYPLAPEYTYRAGFDQLEQVYREVLGQYPGKNIILCGDSAGGGLALAQTLHYRELGLRLPDRLVLFSPWLDVSMHNPGIDGLTAKDKLLNVNGLIQCGQWWAGADDLCHPLISPVYGDVAGLPPIDVIQGTADILLADARKLRDRVIDAGGQINLIEYPEAFHVFIGVTQLPEAVDAFDRIGETLLMG